MSGPTQRDHLVSLTKEIVHRANQVGRLQAKAEDQRRAVAIRLAEARKAAKAAGEKWSSWLATEIRPNLKLSEREVRLLVSIGRAADPAAALEAHRERKAASMRRLRGEPRGPALPAPATMPEDARVAPAALQAAPEPESPRTRPAGSARERLIEALEALDDRTVHAVCTEYFWRRLGMVIRKPEPARGAPALSRQPDGESAGRTTPALEASGRARLAPGTTAQPQAGDTPTDRPGGSMALRDSVPPAGLSDSDFPHARR